MIHPVVLYQYIIIQVRQQTQKYLEIVILVNMATYFGLSYLKLSSGQFEFCDLLA
jgi:hypothetical protein